MLSLINSAKSISELLSVIEGFAASKAAQRVSLGTDPTLILMAFDSMLQLARKYDYENFALSELGLHKNIIQFAQIPELLEIWETTFQKQHIIFNKTLQDYWPDLDILCEGHRNIVDNICEGKIEEARISVEIYFAGIQHRITNCDRGANLNGAPLDKAVSYIALNLNDTIRLQYVARNIAKVSPCHLVRLFKNAYGMSFIEYIQHLRMTRAAQLIKNNNWPINRIAKAVGYQDPSRFSQHFRRKFKMLPSKYSDSNKMMITK
ncbi:MAG: hypothetical protein A2Y10_13315 [Planctomycetes bacterium GWF2_41_51]|nr:MAG: hypothetical protein A2Y10_13315 [Planctomycetes bacterium GWF2_41_51]HBG26287.1 hypothetical protein [Phycisphaerales bacterium]